MRTTARATADSKETDMTVVSTTAHKPRKPHVQVEQTAILAWLDEQRTATLREIAEHFDISAHSARRKADGLVAQGKLTVEVGSRIEKDGAAIPRRYYRTSTARSA